MKKLNFYFLMAMCLLGSLSLASCHDDDDNLGSKNETGNIHPDVSDVQYEVTDSTTLTAEQVADLVYGPDGGNADDETQLNRTAFLEKAQKEAEAYADKTGQNGVVTMYHWVNYKYWSTDQHGKQVKLSAQVLWGRFGFKLFGLDVSKDLDPNNIYLVEHNYLTNNSDAPTQGWAVGLKELFHDNLVIMPDYIGFGETKDRLHPYMNFEVNAKNSYDALAAGYKVYKEYKDAGSDLEKDAKLYILGAGIGAAYGLATQKYIETNNLDEKWNFNYSYLCTGPYSALVTFDTWIKNDNIEFYQCVPMLVKSMFDSYPDLMSGCSEDDFYALDYTLKAKTETEKMLTEKNMDMSDVHRKIKSLMGVTLADNEFIEYPLKWVLPASLPGKEKLRACLAKNDLTKGWTPKHMIKLYQDTSAECGIYPYTNGEALKNAFGDKVNMFKCYGRNDFSMIKAKWDFTLLTGNW